MAVISIATLTATALVTALAPSEMRAEHVLRECLELIDEREPELQAFEHLDPEPALARARQLDAGAVTRPLDCAANILRAPDGTEQLLDIAETQVLRAFVERPHQILTSEQLAGQNDLSTLDPSC